MANGNRSFTIDLKTKLTDKSGIEELKSSLLAVDASVQTQAIGKGGMTASLKEALTTARSLRDVLDSSWNSNLGQLDLGKFKNSIDSSYGSVENLKKSLEGAGIKGSTAYNQLSRDILNTNIQLKTSSKLLDEMATTLSNTVKWGISSSIVNNMSGSIQKAWSFARDLDESLNSIRIVSGKSADEMARFAVEANKAAKSLGATTLDYTEAALIYEQQGLGTEEVAARTETTLKMANVLGESADAVSDYMTAIWNNFAEGADNLEYYGDVITALGAATASSSDEIAAGLEKFASVTGTIGLSYEYATSALATVTATTRQSADVVGTAFKTLFSRIQGLKLGKTLDDGTTLNKYSQALEAVGIDIKDQNGQLKDMDQILDEMGSKWGTLAKDQKVALAQTVAGVRQYNQLMSLMDNWDFFQQNLQVAYKSAGTLAKQQEIYMESLEAKMNGLKAEIEKTWEILFDKDAASDFISLLTKGLEGINSLLTGLGGGMQTFLVLGTALASKLNKSIGGAISRNIQNAEANRSNIAGQELKQEVINSGLASGREKSSLANAALQEQMDLTQRILNLTGELSQEQASELTRAQAEIGKLDQRIEGIKEYKNIYAELNNMDIKSVPETMDSEDFLNEFERMSKYEHDKIQTINRLIGENKELIDNFNTSINNEDEVSKDIEMSLNGLVMDAKADIEQRRERRGRLSKTKGSGKYEDKEYKQNMQDIAAIEEKIANKQVLSEQEISTLLAAQTRNRKEAIQNIARINQGVNGIKDAEGNLLPTLELQTEERKKAADEILTQYERQQMLSQGIKSVTSLISGFASIGGAFSVIDNDNLSAWEKFTSITMSLSFAIPQLVTGFKNIKSIAPAIKIGLEGLAVGIGAVKTAEEAADMSTKQLIVSVLTLDTALGPLWLVLLAVGAAVGTVIAVGYALVKAYNADADAARETKKSVEELTSAYEDCKAKVEELKNAMSQYDNAVNSLKDLKENTDEYREALEKANDEAKALIEKYKLFDNYEYDEKGLIKIDKNVLSDKIAEAERTANEVEATLTATKIAANQTSLKSQRTEFSRKVGMLGRTSKDGIYLEGTTYRSSERMSESIQIDDNSISAIVRGLNNLRDTDAKAYNNATAKDNEEILKNTILGFEGLTPAVKENIDQILKQKDALIALTEATYQAAEENRYYTKELIGGVIESGYEKQFSDFATKNGETDTILANNLTNAMKTLASTRNVDSMQSKIEEAEKKSQDVTNTGDLQEYDKYKDVKNDVDLIRTYANEIMGIDWDTINNHVTIKDDWGKGTMTKDDGTVLIKDKNDEQMRKELAAKAEVDKIKEQYAQDDKEFNDKMAQSLQNLAIKASEFGAQYGTDFTNGVLTSIANGSQNFDFSSIFGEIIDPDAVPELLNMSTEDLMAKLGLDQESLTEYGFASAEQFASAFKAGFEGYQWDMDTAISAAMSKRDEEIDALGLTKSKTEKYKEEIQDYGKYIMQIAEDSEDFADALDKDAESAVVVAQSVIEMNKGIDALADGFEEWSDILKKSSKESQEYADAIGGIQAALSQVYGVEQDYISNDFVTSHMKEIEQVANGSESAIESLRQALAEDIIVNIAVYNGLDETTQSNLINMIHELEATIPDIKVGTEIDMNDETYAGFMQTMQDIINTAGLTAEQANALFSTMGFDTNFATEEKEVEQTSPNTVTETTVKGYTRGTTTGPDGEERSWEYPILSTNTYQDGTSTHTGKMTVMAMATSADGTKVPQIKSITKKGTGKQNNYSSKNKGGKSPGSKKSGGGSSKDPDKMDAVENEVDRYHDVNIALEQISTTLGRLQKQQDKLFGQDLINNLNKQLATLNRQIDKTNEKIQIARGEMRELQGTLSGKGVAFNSDGTIANYAAAYQAQLAYVNSLISKYNAMSAEAQESYKDTVEQAKKDFDKFVEKLKRYDELISNEIPDLEDEIQDAINEQIEIQIQKFNMEIEIRLDLAEATKEWNDFKRTIIDGIKEDDILGTAASKLNDYNIYYNQSGNGIVQAGTRHVNEVLEQLRQMDATGSSNVYGDNRTQALEDLQTYYEQLMSDLEEVDELIQEIEDSYLDLMDEAQEKFDEQIENFEAIGDQLEHDIKLVQLLRGLDDFANTDMYELVDKYYAQQNENYQQQIKFQSSQVEFWKQQMDNAEYASDEWESAREKWMDATSELNSLVESSIDMLQDKYLNMIDSIFDKLNKSITNDFGLDYVSEQWDLINQNADQYLDTINRAYGIQELQNKYLDAIDNTDSISAQQKINELMNSEIQALQNKDKLTQYDLDRAEKKYNLMLKQIALEEAQQNKTKLRLKRDSQGNYTYQYVADEDEISKLKDEISALYNELYNFDLDRYKENVKQAYDVWEEMQSKVYEIYQDTTLTEEERQRKIALIQEQYGELINGIIAENEVVRFNLQESTYLSLDNLYGENITHYEAMTDAQREITNMLIGDSIEAYNAMSEEQKAIISDLCGFTLSEFEAMSDDEKRIYLDLLLGYQNMADTEKEILEGQIVPQWNSSMQDMINSISGAGGFENVCKDTFTNLETQLKEFNTNVGTTLKSASIDMQQLKGATDPAVTSMQNMVTAAGNLTDAYGDQLAQCANVIQQLGQLKTAYDNAASAAKAAATEAYNYWAAAQNRAANAAQQSNQSSSSSSNSSQNSNPQGNGRIDVGDVVTYTGGYYYAASDGSGARGNRGPGRQVTVTQVRNGARYPIHVRSGNSAYGWLTSSQISGYDTGGYTGDWNDNSGRLALLHQKELVLNEEDTKNMLAAVEVIRAITSSIDNNMLNKLATLNASSLGFNMEGETIEQNVHIEATFPNVKDSHEVEDALKNLVNTASQRVYSNKK